MVQNHIKTFLSFRLLCRWCINLLPNKSRWGKIWNIYLLPLSISSARPVFFLPLYPFPFIVSCCAAANSPPSLVYPMAWQEKLQERDIEIFYLASNARVSKTGHERCPQEYPWFSTLFFFFYVSHQDLMLPPRLMKTEYLDETDRYSHKMTFKNPQSFPKAVTVTAIKVDEGESESKLAPFHSPGSS